MVERSVYGGGVDVFEMVNLLKRVNGDLPVTGNIETVLFDQSQSIRSEIIHLLPERSQKLFERPRVRIKIGKDPVSPKCDLDRDEAMCGLVEPREFMFVGDIKKSAVEVEVPAMIFAEQAFCGAVIFTHQRTAPVATGIEKPLDLAALVSDDDNRRASITPQLEITLAGKFIHMTSE